MNVPSAGPAPARPGERGRAAALLAAGLALYAGLALSSMRGESATFDEGAHLPAGYTYLRLGDHRLNPEHPPLVKLLAAAPLLLLDARLKTDDRAWLSGRQWEFGRRFLYRWNDADRLLFWGRVPVVLLGAGLGAAVFLWARRHFGLAPAALALLLSALSPDVLAHGRLVTTDVGVTLFLFLAVVAFERTTARATALRLLLTGLAAGAALATKFSALVLLPILVVLGLVAALAPEPMVSAWRGGKGRPVEGRRRRLLHVGRMLVVVGGIAWLALWASYGFRSALSPDPAQAAAFQSMIEGPPSRVEAAARWTQRAGLLPEGYVLGFLFAFRHSAGRTTFLLGQLSDQGFWYYFPVTFALKTPIPLLVLLPLALAWRRPAPRRLECFLWLPILLYLGLTATRDINIGQRHLLPIYPFLFVVAGRAAGGLSAPGAWKSGRGLLVAGLAAWYALGTLHVHPHYLAYFNELAGGPSQGYRRLVDSNLDWGQDLKGLKAYMDAKGIPRVKLSYFGSADPAYYGIDAELLPGYMAPHPPEVTREVSPGDILAVSATNLQGVYLDPGDRPLMERVRALTPLDEIGYSILIYRADFRWPASPAP